MEKTSTVMISHQASNIPYLHLLPCSTCYQGPANVSQYFQKLIRPEQDHLKTSLVGHDLRGVETRVTEGSKLYWAQMNSNKNDRRLVMQEVLKVIEWTKDLPKELKETSLHRMGEWMDIQQAMHTAD